MPDKRGIRGKEGQQLNRYLWRWKRLRTADQASPGQGAWESRGREEWGPSRLMKKEGKSAQWRGGWTDRRSKGPGGIGQGRSVPPEAVCWGVRGRLRESLMSDPPNSTDTYPRGQCLTVQALKFHFVRTQRCCLLFCYSCTCINPNTQLLT